MCPPKAGEHAPQTWLRYLPSASNAPTEGPKEMEIVLRVRCGSSKGIGGSVMYRTDFWGSDAQLEMRDEPFEEGSLSSYVARVALLSPPVAELFPCRLSTMRLIPPTQTWSFDQDLTLPASAPMDPASPATLTITNIEVKVDGVSRSGDQLQMPLGPKVSIPLVPESAGEDIPSPPRPPVKQPSPWEFYFGGTYR
jgi:hypothetical protein